MKRRNSLVICSLSIAVLSAAESHAEPNTPVELRLGAASALDLTVEDYEAAGLDVNATLLWNIGDEWAAGPTLHHTPLVFGGSSTYGALALGNAGHGTRYWQLLVEAGVHHRTGLGDGFLTSSDADDVSLFYLGATARWVFDIGEPGGFRLDLAISGKRDLFKNTQEANASTCGLFSGCVEEQQEFVTGGWNGVFGYGIAYEFSP